MYLFPAFLPEDGAAGERGLEQRLISARRAQIRRRNGKLRCSSVVQRLTTINLAALNVRPVLRIVSIKFRVPTMVPARPRPTPSDLAVRSLARDTFPLALSFLTHSLSLSSSPFFGCMDLFFVAARYVESSAIQIKQVSNWTPERKRRRRARKTHKGTNLGRRSVPERTFEKKTSFSDGDFSALMKSSESELLPALFLEKNKFKVRFQITNIFARISIVTCMSSYYYIIAFKKYKKYKK